MLKGIRVQDENNVSVCMFLLLPLGLASSGVACSVGVRPCCHCRSPSQPGLCSLLGPPIGSLGLLGPGLSYPGEWYVAPFSGVFRVWCI